MSLKDLFGKTSEKIVSNKQLQDLYNQAESEGYLEELVEDKERYFPPVDFSTASNFARYGSAQRYYEDGIKNIYQNYPYDGSKKEKQEWKNNNSYFDNYLLEKIYPKSTGYLSLNNTNISVVDNKRYSTNPQYIILKGGPNAGSKGTFETSNIYDLSKNRESNLGITEYGNTVEFWFKDSAVSGSSLSQAEYCLFDLWNNLTSSDSNYARLTISKKYSITENIFVVTYASGTAGATSEELNFNFDPYNWHHYAFSFANNGNDLLISLYIDGELKIKNTYSGYGGITLANNYGAKAFIGAYQADSTGNAYGYNAVGSCYGSIDEFRFWKSARNSQQIHRNWFKQVGGGNNTDDANINLGVYYKFNEGIVNTEQVSDLDSVCLDYSGRVTNGLIVNYTLNTRNTGSAIDIYFNESIEDKDPIVYSSNPLVQQCLEEYSSLGYEHDLENNASIYKSIPSWVVDEAEVNGINDLQNLIQIISSYFDTLQLQVEELPNLKNIDFDGVNKPKPFVKNALSSLGFENLEIFNDATFLEEVLSRNEDYDFEKKLTDIKNYIYQNIYNNLSQIYKSKGTEKSFRNLIRCFGVDDELIKINLYANNAEYDFSNKYNYSSVSKKYVDFNNPSRNSAVVYQKSKIGDQNTSGFIANDPSEKLAGTAFTYQAEVIFPQKYTYDDRTLNQNYYTQVSIFGVHAALNDEEDLTFLNEDDINLKVYAIKPKFNSTDAKFKLVGNLLNTTIDITTDTFKDVYTNEKWNFAIRLVPEKYGKLNESSNNIVTDYRLEFSGYNSILDSENNQPFKISVSIPQIDAETALKNNKRIYIGADRTDFNGGSILYYSDVKISSVRFWIDYLTDEELQAHSYDASNFGRLRPNWNVEYNSDSLSITKLDTLALNWQFDNVTGSDSSGNFIVEDISSGSLEESLRPNLGWIGNITRIQHPGYGSFFESNDNQVVNKEYIYSAKQQPPENLNGSDLIQIPVTDDTQRSKSNKPIAFYFSIEKSISQVINDEILKWFATIKDFNNLVGEPADRYRHTYKNLEHLRKLFFKNVNNTPDIERFIEFYKWIDSSISMMISQLVPASADVSSKVRNVVESHLLERNKYTNKLPTIERRDEIISNVSSILNYKYLEQAAPPKNLSSDVIPYKKTAFKPLWLKNRSERDGALVNTPLEPQNDIDREVIRQVVNNKYNNKIPLLYSLDTDAVYESKQDVIRQNANIYNFLTDKMLIVDSRIEITNLANLSQVPLTINVDGSEPQKIKNFKPNYQHSYEYLNSVSRTTNNKSIVDLQGIDISNTTSNSLGLVDRTLPNRLMEDGGQRKTIFAERFSAPGGPEVLSRGGLDRDAEEYSPYNELNNRNLRVRKQYNKWLAETSSYDFNNPSYHKVNKNIARYPGDDNGTTVNTQNDNEFVSHAIPRSDTQYSWISDVLTGSDGFSGYSSGYDNLNKNFLFISSSTYTNSAIISAGLPRVNINYSKFNIFYQSIGIIVASYSPFIYFTIPLSGDPKYAGLKLTYNTSSNTISYNTYAPQNYDLLSIFGVDLNSYLNNLNGPYGWPTWKQIRNNENPLSIISRKNNKILRQDTPNKGETRSQTFSSFIEPSVDYNLPMQHTVLVANSELPIYTTDTYDNNRVKISNENLKTDADIVDRTEPQTHDLLMKYSNDAVYQQQIRIDTASYNQIVFPQKDTFGISYFRKRDSYDDNKSYEKVVNTRTFWKDNYIDRRRIEGGASLYGYYTSSYKSLENYYVEINNIENYWSGVMDIYPPQSSTGSMKINFMASSSNSSLYNSIWSLDNKTQINNDNYETIERTNAAQSINVTYSVNFEENIGPLAPYKQTEHIYFITKPEYSGSDSSPISIKQNNILVAAMKYSNNRIAPRPQLLFTNHPPSYIVHPTNYFSGAIEKLIDRETLLEETNIIFPFRGSSPYVTNNFYGSYNATSRFYTINNGYDYDAEQVSGKKPFYNSYEEYYEDIRGKSKNYSIIPEYKINDVIENVILKAGGQFNKFSFLKLSIDGHNFNYPNINDPDNFSNKLINTNNINDKILNYDNSVIPQEINIEIDTVNKFLPYRGFYPAERVVQLSELFINSIFDLSKKEYNNLEYDSLLNSGRISYANGVPSLAVGDNSGSGYGGVPIDQQVLTLLQPFFAPGILLNTIKSSIAVDWLAKFDSYKQDVLPYENDNYLVSAYDDGIGLPSDEENIKYYVLGNGKDEKIIDFRFPFESILDFEKYLPAALRTGSMYYLDPTHYSSDAIGNLSQKAVYPCIRFGNRNTDAFPITWKDNRYKLAINNFLAQIPEFFIKNGRIQSIVSDKEIDFKQAISGVLYTMNLELEKPAGFKPYMYDRAHEFLDNAKVNFFNSSSYNSLENNLENWFGSISEDSVFGPPSKFWPGKNQLLLPIYSGFGTYLATYQYSPYRIISKPAYAPYVPPYYYGKSVAKIEFRPQISKKYTLKEIFDNCTVTCVNEEAEDLFLTRNKFINPNLDYSSDTVKELVRNTPAYKNMMHITSSINIFGRKELPAEVFYNKEGIMEQVVEGVNNYAWSIQPKFETPSINFANSTSPTTEFVAGKRVANSLFPIPAGTTGYIDGIYKQNFKGLWTSYGTPVDETSVDAGPITMKLTNPYYGPDRNINTSSLIDLCGFKETTKKIGLIAEEGELSEAIIVIPYTTIKNHDDSSGLPIDSEYATTITNNGFITALQDDPYNLDNNSSSSIYDFSTNTYISEPTDIFNITNNSKEYLFRVSYDVLNKLLPDIGFGTSIDTSLKYQNVIKTLESPSVKGNYVNTILKTVDLMTKYVIPPQLDWVLNNVTPFVMYIAEVKTDQAQKLNKEDISDIWQNVMPNKLRQAFERKILINHKLSSNEFFEGKKLPNDIKFKIFKVKKRAKYDYYQLTDKFDDDQNYKFTLNKDYKKYSYNWPHDFFSLVELVNVKAAITSNFKQVKEPITINVPEIVKSVDISNNNLSEAAKQVLDKKKKP